MGILREVGGKRISVLEAEHVVGRSRGCSLCIDSRYVSAEHAHLRFSQGRWEVKDLGSLNGTNVDGVRIQAGVASPLKCGSIVSFGKADMAWELADESAPNVLVVPIEGGAPVPVNEEGLIVLPSEDDPRVTIYCTESTWVLEQPNESITPITNAQVFEVDGRAWRFSCPESLPLTALVTGPRDLAARHLALQFYVSRDEEFVEIRASLAGTTVALGSRSFNYLLLTLARQRIADAKEGLPEAACGWIFQEDLAHDPTMAPPQLNIDVFRIRRHFAAAGIAGAAGIVERRPRTQQLRIGTPHLEIVVT